MRKLILLLILTTGLSAMAQTDGLVYQAVILDPAEQQIPGQDLSGNVYANKSLSVRFSIISTMSGIEYQETHETNTDAYGMIKVIIGQGTASIGSFDEISWDGSGKDLKVDINLEGFYRELSNQKLLFLPFAYHRNITATGTLDVNGKVFFQSDLTVDGTTDLEQRLGVFNESPVDLSGRLEVDLKTVLHDSLTVTGGNITELSGMLIVDKETQLNSTLDTEGATKLKSTLDVLDNTVLNELRVLGQSPTFLSGTLRVDGESNFNSAVNINNGSPLNLSGDLTVGGAVTFNDDLTVEGETNLNNSLSVNNSSPTTLSGTLNVSGQTTLNDLLDVNGETNLENLLRVKNQSSTSLSGTLDVGLATNLNSALSVLNSSPTLLTGPLNVNGEIDFGNDLTVDGITNLFGDLTVNNGSDTNLSGTLSVDGDAMLSATLLVDGNTTMNNDLEVANQSSTLLTGTLEVDGATMLNDNLEVRNASPTLLTGTLGVNGLTSFNAALGVLNGSSSNLSGTLNVTGISRLNNSLEVTNAAATYLSGSFDVNGQAALNNTEVTNAMPANLSGTLDVAGISNFNDLVNVSGKTDIQNDLTVTGSTSVTELLTGSIAVQADRPDYLATFTNTNADTGDGISISLGKTHGRWINGGLRKVDQTLVSNEPGPNPSTPPSDPTYQTAFNTMKSILTTQPSVSVNDIIGLLPSFRSFAIPNVNNIILQEIDTRLGLPKNLPSVTLPGFRVPDPPGISLPFTAFPGIGPICSGQACFSVCIPFAGCYTVCIPPVNVCVPRIPPLVIPELHVPNVNISPSISNFLPPIPLLNQPSMPNVSIPNIPKVNVPNSLTSENNYFTFQDFEGRQTGTVRAQSIEDFVNNTILDPVYAFNVASSFVGVDLADGISSGGTAMVNLIKQFNKMGVEYSSGNGDYSEWLERLHPEESLSAGDIIAVKGGKITRDLTNYEQLMIVSHFPIVLGNVPEEGKAHLGNTVAFIGQVPAKVIGPVASGDYIVAKGDLKGYGVAIAPENMKTSDYRLAVGRAWEDNAADGPKMVNTVVGLQNGDFSQSFNQLAEKQRRLDSGLDELDVKLDRISTLLRLSDPKNKEYASNE